MGLDIASDVLKSASDTKIPFYSFKQIFTTIPITHDCLNEFGKVCKSVIITNFDGVGNVIVVTKDPNNPPDTIPPSTKGSQDEWVSFVKITPNAVTGNGILELQLVDLPVANDPDKLAMKAAELSSKGMTPKQIQEQIMIDKTWM